jgi:hypothetical protein
MKPRALAPLRRSVDPSGAAWNRPLLAWSGHHSWLLLTIHVPHDRHRCSLIKTCDQGWYNPSDLVYEIVEDFKGFASADEILTLQAISNQYWAMVLFRLAYVHHGGS